MMKRIGGGCLALVGTVLALGVGIALIGAALNGVFQDPLDRALDWEAKRADQERAQAQADALAPVQTFAWQLLIIGVPALMLAGGAVALFTRVDAYLQQRPQLGLVWPEEGQYPIPQRVLAGPEGYELRRLGTQGYHLAQIAEAENVGTPEHYAPQLSYEYENRQDLPAGVPPAQLVSPAFTAPAFADLLARQQIGPGQPLLLGYSADGQPLTGALKDWRSGCVSGLPGAGKTNSMRFYGAQAAMLKARLVILDPHADASNPEETLAHTLAPLAPAFLCEPASAPREMLAALHLVHDLMERRLHGEPADHPVFCFVDEGVALLGHQAIGPELARLLESITLQGRKTLIQCCIGGQSFGSERVPTTLRDNLSTCLVHRMKRNQARLLLPNEEARKVETLPTGAAVLWRADGSLADVTIPLTTTADMHAVGRLLTVDARPTSSQVVANSQQPAPAEWWDVLTQTDSPVAARSQPVAPVAMSPPVLSPVHKRALTLWRARKTPAEIVTLLGYTYVPSRGPHKGETMPVTSDAGAVYIQRLNEVLDLIHDAEEIERQQPPAEGEPA